MVEAPTYYLVIRLKGGQGEIRFKLRGDKNASTLLTLDGKLGKKIAQILNPKSIWSNNASRIRRKRKDLYSEE